MLGIILSFSLFTAFVTFDVQIPHFDFLRKERCSLRLNTCSFCTTKIGILQNSFDFSKSTISCLTAFVESTARGDSSFAKSLNSFIVFAVTTGSANKYTLYCLFLLVSMRLFFSKRISLTIVDVFFESWDQYTDKKSRYFSSGVNGSLEFRYCANSIALSICLNGRLSMSSYTPRSLQYSSLS